MRYRLGTSHSDIVYRQLGDRPSPSDPRVAVFMEAADAVAAVRALNGQDGGETITPQLAELRAHAATAPREEDGRWVADPIDCPINTGGEHPLNCPGVAAPDAGETITPALDLAGHLQDGSFRSAAMRAGYVAGVETDAAELLAKIEGGAPAAPGVQETPAGWTVESRDGDVEVLTATIDIGAADSQAPVPPSVDEILSNWRDGDVPEMDCPRCGHSVIDWHTEPYEWPAGVPIPSGCHHPDCTCPITGAEFSAIYGEAVTDVRALWAAGVAEGRRQLDEEIKSRVLASARAAAEAFGPVPDSVTVSYERTDKKRLDHALAVLHGIDPPGDSHAQ